MNILKDLFLIVLLTLEVNGEDGKQYAVLLDAGSSSTKVNVYSWKTPSTLFTVPILNQTFKEAVKPGISEFADTLTEIDNYLQQMLTTAKSQIPHDQHSSTLLLFMATAGLRIYKGQKTKAIIAKVHEVLNRTKEHGFLYRRGNSRVLSGEEEAVFAWIAVNDLLGFFREPSKGSVGILEMGGGSTQICYIPKGPIYSNKFIVQIAGRYYSMYAHSYLNFGQNYISDRVTRNILNQNSTEVKNPCRLKGDDTIYSHGTKNVTVIGEGNPTKCDSILSSFFYKQFGDKCYPKPCSIGNIYQPRNAGLKFYATEAFVYPTFNLNATDSMGRLHIDRMKKDAAVYCQLTLDQAVQRGAKRKFASGSCLMGLYIPQLLTKAYGFPTNTKNITIVQKIKGQAAAWTRGAVLYEIEKHRQLKCSAGTLFSCTLLTLSLLQKTFLWLAS